MFVKASSVAFKFTIDVLSLSTEITNKSFRRSLIIVRIKYDFIRLSDKRKRSLDAVETCSHKDGDYF
jgi:hypothetical protein